MTHRPHRYAVGERSETTGPPSTFVGGLYTRSFLIKKLTLSARLQNVSARQRPAPSPSGKTNSFQ